MQGHRLRGRAGLIAILVCRSGSGKVIAIEANPSIGLLHQLARDNGFADRLERMAINALCLSLIDGERSLSAIADRVATEFPAVFADVGRLERVP